MAIKVVLKFITILIFVHLLVKGGYAASGYKIDESLNLVVLVFVKLCNCILPCLSDGRRCDNEYMLRVIQRGGFCNELLYDK